MILTFYLNKLYGLTKYLQRIKKLYALTDRDIGVYGTMQEQQRSVNLVGIEERTLLSEEVGVLPGIAVSCRDGIVAVAPITLAPVAGDVTDASV